MNPWLILGGLGLLGLFVASKASASQAPAPAAPTGPGVLQAPAIPANVTPSNTMAAFKYALAHETDPGRLAQFGTALIAYGYAAQGQALLAKSARLAAQAGQPPPSAVPPSMTAPTPGAAPSQGALDPWTAPSHFDPNAPGPGWQGTSTQTTHTADQKWIQWWVDHYLGTNIPQEQAPTQKQIQDAVTKALATEKDPSMLVHFASMIQQYQQQGVSFYDPKGVTQLETHGLEVYTKKYANTDKVDAITVQHAINNAKTHGSSADLLNFAQVASYLSTMPDDFLGLNWAAIDADLNMASQAAIIRESQAHGGH